MNIYYREHTPSPPLKPFIHSFWSITSSGLSRDISPRQRCFPSQHCQWIIQVKGRNCIGFNGDDVFDCSDSFFTGFNEVAPVWAMYGQSEMFGIRLAPEFAVSLFNLPFGEFNNHHMQASDWLGKQADLFAEQLNETDDTSERIHIAEQFFISHIKRIHLERNYLSEALRLLREQDTGVIENISKKVYVGERQLQRTFKSTLGISPCFYSRMVRLYKAYHHALYGKGNLTHIAYNLGYADAAHFSREFKDYFGSSPANHFNENHFQPMHIPAEIN
ncbi:MAG: helix-turn-helix transcriptional regulator [Chitinophagaceae bacterium]|nr:helix-turn-helix transcriptional regulator [Chitinophagaceae bacterium]